MPSIEWRHDGRRLVVPVAILRPFDGTMLQFELGRGLIDTGATSSGITREMVDRLGLSSQGKRPMTGVHGEQQTDRYVFRIGLFGDDTTAGSVPFIFEESDGFGIAQTFQYQALIGMDVLRQCDLKLSRNGRCELRFGFA